MCVSQRDYCKSNQLVSVKFAVTIGIPGRRID